MLPLEHDFHSTTYDTPLNDLIGVAAESKFPIAVTENNRLLGIIVRVSILSGLILGKEQKEAIV